jgi:cytochrome c oxidase subunit I+III
MGMPRRVYTYHAGQGFDLLNLISTIGAYVLAAGFAVLLFDALRTAWRKGHAERDPWRGGTLEWLGEIPGRAWNLRSIPVVHSRYPLWDQPGLMQDVDAGRFYLPDAEEGRRETLITSTIDAVPEQCLRVPGPTWLTLWAAVFTGGAFIFPVFHQYVAAGVSGAIAMGVILAWLWTGTAQIPEKPAKDVGLGTTLPLYASGDRSVGWWAMFITMIGDSTAFASLVFGYFYFWTIHPDFPPADAGGPGLAWPLLALGAGIVAWLGTLGARRLNQRFGAAGFNVAAAIAVAAAIFATAALLLGPLQTGLDPTAHAYPATVWLLSAWTAVHVAVGVLMLLYCMARRVAGQMTATHDIDIRNATLYWHFVAITLLVTVATIAGFPLLA